MKALKIIPVALLLFNFFMGNALAAEPPVPPADPPGEINLISEPVTGGEYLRLQGLVVFNQMEGGFYEVAGHRLVSPVDFSLYKGQDVLLYGYLDDSPSIQMVKAVRVLAFRLTAEANEMFNYKEIEIFMNGGKVYTDVAPVLKHDRVLVPVRVISEKLGAQVQWNSASKTVSISNKYMAVKLAVGSNQALVYHQFDFSGIPEAIILDQTVEIIDGRTVVPLRFIFERFDAQVRWEQEGQLVIIESGIFLPAEVTATGTYVGQMDNNFIEIIVDGLPEETATQAFQLSFDLKGRFDSIGLRTNDAVRITFIPRADENSLLLSIEKI